VAAKAAPDPEVVARPSRRRFTAIYKLAILRRADQCREGELGALLRKEGLYSSHLTAWRRQRDQGELDALQPRRRGRPPKQPAADAEVARLRRENERLTQRLATAEAVIEIQKKVASLLGVVVPSNSPESGRP
jgi:transposase-like protein